MKIYFFKRILLAEIIYIANYSYCYFTIIRWMTADFSSFEIIIAIYLWFIDVILDNKDINRRLHIYKI